MYLELANEDDASFKVSPKRQLSQKQLLERSPELQERSPEPQERSPEPQERSPELQERLPDPQEQSPESQERSPESTDELVEVEDAVDGLHDEEESGLTYCQVLYSFDASSDVELSVEEGKWVWLLKSHDRTGNSEWWLVQKEGGAKGFVPANYLQSS